MSTIAVLRAQPVSLIVRQIGAHEFQYTKIDNNSGETIWRWPQRPLPAPPSATGALVDIQV